MKWGLTKKRDNSSNIDQFDNEMDHFFNNFFSMEPFQMFDSKWDPSVDVKEDDNMIQVTAELPGIDEKDLNVTLEKNCLLISGEKNENREEKSKKGYYCERKFGSFSRRIALPEGIKTEEIKANYKNGVLILEIPKEEIAKSKKIEIKVK